MSRLTTPNFVATGQFVKLGQLLVRRLQQGGGTNEQYTACLAILIGELDYYEETELLIQLDTLIATYVVFHPRISSPGTLFANSPL